MTGFEPLYIVVGVTLIAVIATVSGEFFKNMAYGPDPYDYVRGDDRLSNCCAEEVFGEYDFGPVDEPPIGICKGCGYHAIFYTEKEFEKIDLEKNGYNYGQFNDDEDE